MTDNPYVEDLPCGCCGAPPPTMFYDGAWCARCWEEEHCYDAEHLRAERAQLQAEVRALEATLDQPEFPAAIIGRHAGPDGRILLSLPRYLDAAEAVALDDLLRRIRDRVQREQAAAQLETLLSALRSAASDYPDEEGTIRGQYAQELLRLIEETT